MAFLILPSGKTLGVRSFFGFFALDWGPISGHLDIPQDLNTSIDYMGFITWNVQPTVRYYRRNGTPAAECVMAKNSVGGRPQFGARRNLLFLRRFECGQE